jgi:hypothetical protein
VENSAKGPKLRICCSIDEQEKPVPEKKILAWFNFIMPEGSFSSWFDGNEHS